MFRRTLIFICSVFIFPGISLATGYSSAHFIIESAVDKELLQHVRASAETFYNIIKNNFHVLGWEQPLKVYYSKSESETVKLLKPYGVKYARNKSYYHIGSVPAVYTHHLTKGSKDAGLEGLYYAISQHLIYKSFPGSPGWFKKGLGSFWAQQVKIVKGKMVVSSPQASFDYSLRDNLKGGLRPNIRFLITRSDKQFEHLPYGFQFARELFYWLYKTGNLNTYLQKVPTQGYGISVLEEATSKSLGQINLELRSFLEANCFAEAYLAEALTSDVPAKKIQSLMKSIDLLPNYEQARLELARCFLQKKEYQKCKENLQLLLNGALSWQYPKAAQLMGESFYEQKHYQKAIEYYKKARDNCSDPTYKYRIAYKLGNCYYYLGNRDVAKQWYQRFLSSRWDYDDMKQCADYARDYIQKDTAGGSSTTSGSTK